MDGVNTPICEQLFKKVNQHANCKSMNSSRFFLFWYNQFETHNLDIEGLASTVPDLRSTHRWENIEIVPVVLEEEEAPNKEPEVESVLNLLKDTHLEKEPKFEREICQARYDKRGNYENHMLKHNDDAKLCNASKKHKCDICKKTLQTKRNKCCKTCKVKFESVLSCKEHEKTHTMCALCKVDFEFPSKLARHIKQKHS